MATTTINSLLVFLLASACADEKSWNTELKYVKNEVKAAFVGAIYLDGGFLSHGCLFRENYFLTTQDGVRKARSPNQLRVHFGRSIREWGSVTVTNIYLHPDFNPETISHNIAILKLRSSEIPHKVYKKNVTLHALPSDLFGGFTVYGWALFREEDLNSRYLAESTRRLIGRGYCQKRYDKPKTYKIDKTMFCFLPKRNLFRNYSGAPLVFDDARGMPQAIKARVLAGLYSFRVDRKGARRPEVYTDVNYFRSWIDSNTN